MKLLHFHEYWQYGANTGEKYSYLYNYSIQLVGIWFYDRWLHYGSSQDIKFVELGPGRGTLVADILRV